MDPYTAACYKLVRVQGTISFSDEILAMFVYFWICTAFPLDFVYSGRYIFQTGLTNVFPCGILFVLWDIIMHLRL